MLTADGITSLWIAAQNGHTEIVQALLASGADPNKSCGKYGTPLDVAHAQGHSEITKLLSGN